MDIDTRGIKLSRKRTTKALIRLCGCAGWSALFVRICQNMFSHDGAQDAITAQSVLVKTQSLFVPLSTTSIRDSGTLNHSAINKLFSCSNECDVFFIVTYVSWSSDSVLYLENYLMDECCTADIGIVSQENWPEAVYVGQWPIFQCPVILSCILKTTCRWWANVIIGILGPCDEMIYLIKCMLVSDLHFMVQWFCLMHWRRFDRGMLYWNYWFRVTLTLTFKWLLLCEKGP